MIITAVSVGTRGDVQPLIELGVEMTRRGHVCDLYHIPCVRYFYSPFDKTNQYSLYTTKHNKVSVGWSYAMVELCNG